MPELPTLTATELAEMAEAAITLGMPAHAQIVLDAAYARIAGLPVFIPSDMIGALCGAAISEDGTNKLTTKQKEIFRIVAAIKT